MALPDTSRLPEMPGAQLAERFREIGLTRGYVREMVLPGDDLRSPLAPSRPALLLDDPAPVALRLFFCRTPVSKDLASAALGQDLLQVARNCGVVIEAEPDGLVSPFHLRIVEDLYLFSDYLGKDPEAVMGAGETTAILLHAGRPNRAVSRALDLGCGAGTLGLLLAPDAGEVVGTDINPRAVTLARFNAAVNKKENVEFRAGDVYAPVEGEVFDVILSQPPYYPDPRGVDPAQVFLHGGQRGDELSQRVVEGIPEHLAPDGRAIVFTSWPEARSEAAPDSLQVLELTTGRSEPHGTCQSLNVIQHADPGEGWSASFDVAADCWGHVTSDGIDRILAAQELLQGPEEKLLSASLTLPEGTVPLREDSQMILQCPPESLVGCAPVDEQSWALISSVHDASDVKSAIENLESPRETVLPVVEAAVRRGLLVPE